MWDRYTLWLRNPTSNNFSSGKSVWEWGDAEPQWSSSWDELTLTFWFFSPLFSLIFYRVPFFLTPTIPQLSPTSHFLICILWNVLPPLFCWHPPISGLFLVHLFSICFAEVLSWVLELEASRGVINPSLWGSVLATVHKDRECLSIVEQGSRSS